MERAIKTPETQLIAEAISNSNRMASSVSCWRCLGVGTLLVTRGDQVLAKNCLCLRRRTAKSQLSLIPPVFGNPKLSKLEPRTEHHARQVNAIEYVRLHPDESYLLLGRNGTGKSHIAWALYRHAISKLRPFIACSVRDLIAEFRRVELGTQEREPLRSPQVAPADLRGHSRRWFLFFDEFEKARPSEFAAEQLFSLLNAAASFGHQLVITSNFTDKQLQDHWNRASEVYGSSIMMRLQICTLIELF